MGLILISIYQYRKNLLIVISGLISMKIGLNFLKHLSQSKKVLDNNNQNGQLIGLFVLK